MELLDRLPMPIWCRDENLAITYGNQAFHRLIDLPHGYWVPLTTLAILQPTEHGTLVRSLQRAAGTVCALETLRRGLRADTLKEVLLGDRTSAS